MTSSQHCPVRKVAVSCLPEEQVRVQLLFDLIEKLGFPQSGLAIEKQLSHIPHLRSIEGKLPKRRADIICFAKGIVEGEDLYPLLLIECKAVKITTKMVNQVVGYNHFLKAKFIALVNADEIRLGWYDVTTNAYRFINYLPTYEQLIAAVSQRI